MNYINVLLGIRQTFHPHFGMEVRPGNTTGTGAVQILMENTSQRRSDEKKNKQRDKNQKNKRKKSGKPNAI